MHAVSRGKESRSRTQDSSVWSKPSVQFSHTLL